MANTCGHTVRMNYVNGKFRVCHSWINERTGLRQFGFKNFKTVLDAEDAIGLIVKHYNAVRVNK